MSATKFDTEIKDFISRLDYILAAVDDLKKEGRHNYTIPKLKDCYDNTFKQMMKWLEDYIALKKNVPKSKQKDYEIFGPEYMYRARERYQEAQDYLTLEMDTLKCQQTSDKVTSGEVNPDAAPILLDSGSPELPVLRLPKFGGDPASWTYFENLFTSCIIKNKRLCDAERLFHLIACLEGEALAMIEPFKIADFELAWDTLKRYFGSPRIVIPRLLDSIVHLKPIKRDDLESLKQVTVGWRQTLAALKKLDCPAQHWGILLVFLVEKKLEPPLNIEWELSLKGTKEYPSFDRMLEFLDTYVIALLCPNEDRRKAVADSQVNSL